MVLLKCSPGLNEQIFVSDLLNGIDMSEHKTAWIKQCC